MRKRRGAMELVTPKLMKMWKDWEVRSMVLTSLVVQIILIILGGRRKYIRRAKLRTIVWCSYLLADSVATIALGILTNNLGDIYNKRGEIDLKTKLTAFWAPFLLLHLGGPDTITAYSLEDNQLWLRHCWGLIVQTAVTGYIFFMAWSFNSRLSWLSIPMIVVGSIKYGEKTWTLWQASTDQLRDSMLTSPDPGPNYSKLMNEYRLKQAEGFFMEIEEVKDVPEELDVAAPPGTTPDEQNIIKANALFQTFKYLFVDLILSFKDREKSQSSFQKMSFKDAFDVVAIELGFMYDKLYTKATVIYTPPGLIRRITTFCLFLLVLLVFCFEDMKKYKKADISVTSLLLLVAVVLEIIAALSILIWHIATELCYFSEAPLSAVTSDIQSSREVSYRISNYMFHLLVAYPFLLPIGIGLIRFRDTKAETERFFKERLTLSRIKEENRIRCNKTLLQTSDSEFEEQEEENNTNVLPEKVKGDSSKSLLFDACPCETLVVVRTESTDMVQDNWSRL
ncbi:hypothetical protein V6N13_090779 [Hibiscus sabdariffa]